MKKMLSTMLATLVLSAAVVSTVDAKRESTKRGGRGAKKSTMAPVAKDVLVPAREAVTAKKEGDKAATADSAKETVAALTSPDMTDAQKELVAKRSEEAELEKQIKLKNYEKSDIGYGWFGIGSSKEQQTEMSRIKSELTTLGKSLKDAKTRIRQLEVETGKAWSNAVRYGIAALAAVGITAVAYGADRYGFITGEAGGAVKYLGEQGMATVEGAKSRLMDLYESTPDVPYFGSKARAERAQ